MTYDRVTPTPVGIPFDPAPFLKSEAKKRARYEAAVAEHRREEAARQASYAVAVRQTIVPFRPQ